MANTLQYGFRPHGAGHTTIKVTLAGTVSKGDLLTYDGSGAFVIFNPASHFLVAAVALKAGVSGDEIPAVLIDESTILEVSTGLTYAAATNQFEAYDVTGATGAQYLTTTSTKKHFMIIGAYPVPKAPDATGANTNVLVQLNTARALNSRQVKLAKTAATLSGTYTISNLTPSQVYVLDPGGAGRNVVLPQEMDGSFLVIVNAADAAENITVKASDASTTVNTIGQNETGLFFCDGTTWTGVGLSSAAI